MEDVLEEEAREAWAEELRHRGHRLREAASRDVATLRRRLEVLHVVPEQPDVHYDDDGTARILLCSGRRPAWRHPDDEEPTPARPTIWATVRHADMRLRASILDGDGDLGPLADAGSLDTLADLGRALEEGGQRSDAEAEESTAELMAKLLRALVDDAVDERLRGEL